MNRRVESQIICKEHELFEQIDLLCFYSKNVYNYSNYLIRQEFIKTSKEKEQGLIENAVWLHCNDLDKILAKSQQVDYIALPNNSSQKVLQQLETAWKSFFQANKAYNKNPSKFTGRPKLPKYKDKTKGRNLLIFTANQFKVKNNEIHFPKKTNLPSIKSGLDLKSLKLNQIRFVPCTNHTYKIEIVYEKPESKIKIEPNSNIIGIDLGITNLLTLTSNVDGFKPILIKGGKLKSINQYYNKEKARLQSNLQLQYKDRFTSNRIDKLTKTRNNRIEDSLHKISKYIKDLCLEHNVSKVVIGLNKDWKQEINIGSVNNQNFVNIPHSKLINLIRYKLEEIGVILIVREESYTSKCSSFDLEEIKKHETYKGKRTKRGLFKTSKGLYLNADVNGSLNIIRKEFGDAAMPADRGLILNPVSVRI